MTFKRFVVLSGESAIPGNGCPTVKPGYEPRAALLSGDGGLAMLMGDLLSLRQLDLPAELIVFDNIALGFVELEMKVAACLISRRSFTTRISRRWPTPQACSD